VTNSSAMALALALAAISIGQFATMAGASTPPVPAATIPVSRSGAHYYGTIGSTVISVGNEMTATRFVRDALFATGFD
jgi:hypothetical protein